MSLAIVLGGWAAASIIFSPLIGRFLSVADRSPGESRPAQNVRRISTKPRYIGNTGVRRNVVTPLHRREAGWPRLG
jgi:hypothetical protein